MEIRLQKRLNGQRIYLEKTEPTFENAIRMFAVVERNRNHILPWMEWASADKTKTAEDSFKFMDKAETDWQSGRYYNYLIHLVETGEIIGGLGVSNKDMDRPHKVEIGYWLDRDKCRNGYMKEAVQLVEKEIFNQGFKRIVICNDVENIPSARVAKSLGYRLEGIAVQERWNETLGCYRNMNHWAKVRD